MLGAIPKGERGVFFSNVSFPVVAALMAILLNSTEVSAAIPVSVSETLAAHCVQCHGPEKSKGDLRLDTLAGDFDDRTEANAWLEVRTRVNLGEMPPDEEDALAVDAITEISQFVTEGLRQAERRSRGAGGDANIRRLNRREYAQTIEDLLEITFLPGESPLDLLPPDGSAEGFDKVGGALFLDPSLMSSFYQVARRVADVALVEGPPDYPTEVMRLEYEDMADSRAIGYLTTRLGLQAVEGGVRLVEGQTRSFGMLRYPGRRDNNVAPVSGFYRFTVRASGAPGADGEAPILKLEHKHPDDSMRILMEIPIEAPWDAPQEYTVVVPRDTLGGELEISMVNAARLTMLDMPTIHFNQRNRDLGGKDFAEVIRLAGRKAAEGWSAPGGTIDPDKLDLTQHPRLFLDYLEVEGPLYDSWPPPSHQSIVFDGPLGDRDPEAYAREIFARFLPKAWRRPVESDEIEPIVGLVSSELDAGASFIEALRVGLTAALTSPQFLFLGESMDGADRASFALAERLAAFLWGSMPDEALSQAARRGVLAADTELRSQVDRMLADPKRERFVRDFATQWLRVEDILAFTPDPQIYREFDAELAKAAIEEPVAFFAEALERDLPLSTFLNSDFVMVNQRLAEHYGFDGVRGKGFRPMALPRDSERGGLLGMMGVHLAGSDGIRTKPVSRAAYVREVLFNDPPDPPPPNAGEIEPNIEGENLSVRDRLLQHQEIESCAACHRSLDPYGLALENFNVVGSWRDHQDGEDFRRRDPPDIDASGLLPNGVPFADFFQFRERLLGQEDRLRRGLAEKLLVYGLGRPISPADDAALIEITDRTRAQGDSLRALIHALVQSSVFREL